jgi:ribonuclease HII
MLTPPRAVLHRAAGLYTLERALQRRGFAVVAGADEAGRGACAGPLVVAAVVLPPGRRGEVDELADSKLLTPAARERVYRSVVAQATAYSVVVIPPGEIDARGLHVCNVAGMRRAFASLAVRPEYVLIDGFRVDGLGIPALAVWKGDQVAACVAAASVVAKVTRDRIMVELDGTWPQYGFAEHKGYVTVEHSTALDAHGPCRIHRFSYANVAGSVEKSRRGELDTDSLAGGVRARGTVGVASGGTAALPVSVGDNGGMEGGVR